MAGRAWVLAVDYGTSNTVAAAAEADGTPRLLQFGGQVSLPSAVFLDPGSPTPWLVGRDALRAALAEPENLEPNPKLWIGEKHVYLAGRATAPTTLIAATLATVFFEAWRQHDGTAPAVIVLTYPATWPRSTRQLLEDAARQAIPHGADGIRIVLVAEPVAAAWHAGRSRQVPGTARIAVLDLGAGTCDVAVVDRHEGTYRIAATPLGLDGLGGEDFDHRLLRAVLAELGRPELEHTLLEVGDAGLRSYRELRLTCREAKEQLSGHPQARVLVPVPDAPDPVAVTVTRSRLQQQLLMSEGPQLGLDSAAELVAQALDQAPQSRADDFVFLVGGSSRIPLLGRLVEERTGLRPLEHGDPGTAVAEGAAHLATTLLDTRQPGYRPELDPAPEPAPTLAQVARPRTPPHIAEPAPPETAAADASRSPRARARRRPRDRDGLGRRGRDRERHVGRDDREGRPRLGPKLLVVALAVLLVIGVAGGISVYYQNRVTCWEGTTVSSVQRCPELTGPAALQYIYQVPEGQVCQGQRQNLQVAQVAAVNCEDPARPDVKISFVQWKNVAVAQTELGLHYEDAGVRDGDVIRYRMDRSEAGLAYEASLYEDYPFSYAVQADDPATRDAAVRRISRLDTGRLSAAGPVPTTPRGDTECWDGAIADSIQDCRKLAGPEALRWVFWVGGENGLENCTETPSAFDGVMTELTCQVRGEPEAVVRLRQWASTEQAVAALTPHYGVAPVELDEGPARRWTARADGLAWSEWMYQDAPFSEAVGHPQPGVAAQVEDDLYARHLDSLQVRGGVDAAR